MTKNFNSERLFKSDRTRNTSLTRNDELTALKKIPKLVANKITIDLNQLYVTNVDQLKKKYIALKPKYKVYIKHKNVVESFGFSSKPG